MMIADKLNSESKKVFGNFKSVTDINKSLFIVLDSVCEKFAENVILNKLKDYSEDDLTGAFVKLANSIHKSETFTFQNQDKIPRKRYKYDVGIYLSSNVTHSALLCVIEAKRLPTPKSTKRKETEYVFGNESGGIERFKNCKYVKNLSYSFIFGYLQESDFSSWKEKINSWVDIAIKDKKSKLTWNKKDKLENHKQLSKTITQYKSLNYRLNKTAITLYHYHFLFN